MANIVDLTSSNWGTSLCRSLEEMWRAAVVCDTVIYANDGQTFNAHAAVLMASSPYLKNLLWALKKQVFSVEMNNINSDTWTAVLNFIYTGNSTIERSQLEVIYEAADRLEIKELSKLCLEQLNNQPLAGPTSVTIEDDDDNDEMDAEDLSLKEKSPLPTDLSMKSKDELGKQHPEENANINQVPNMPAWMSPPMKDQPHPPMGLHQWPFPFPHPLLPQPLLPNQNAIIPNASNPHISSNADIDLQGKEEDKKHKCNVCGKRFRLRHVLQQHALTHTSLKPYYCDICGFRARQKAVIWKHKKLKHGSDSNKNSPVKSEISNGEIQEYLNNEEYLDPIHTTIPDHGSPYKEDNSSANSFIYEGAKGAALSPKMSYQDSNYSSGNKMFECKTCGKSFRNKHVLAQHELIHSNFRPYACDYCNFRAKQKAVIWRHIKVKHPDMKEVSYRTEDPPEQNDKIEQEEEVDKPTLGLSLGKKVNTVIERLKNSLSTKKRRTYDMNFDQPPTMVSVNPPAPVTLTGYNFLRRYQCRICNKMFKNKHILMQHELVHSNLRPYKCDFCGFRAKQKAVMWRHHKSRHPEKGRVRIVEDTNVSLLHEASMEAAIARNGENNFQPLEPENEIKSPDLSFQRNDMESPLPVNMPKMDANNHANIEENHIDMTDEDLDEKSEDEDEGDAFFCQICGKGFNDEHSMEKHKEKHSEFKPFVCNVCKLHFRTEDMLNQHKELKHYSYVNEDEKEAIIQDALNKASSREEPKMASQHPYSISPSNFRNKFFHCNMCDFSTRHQTSLSRHKRLKHEGEMKSDDASSPKHDAEIKADETSSQCSSNEESELLEENAATNIAKLNSESSLNSAKLINFCLQQNPNSFPMFPNPANMFPVQMPMLHPLPQSLPSSNGESDKRYMCNVCGRGFKHRHVLHQHSLVHTDLKPYACEFCDFRGRQKASLWRHRQKHLSEMNKESRDQHNLQMDNKRNDLAQGAIFPNNGELDDDSFEGGVVPDDGLLMAEDYGEPDENEEGAEKH